MEIKRITCGRSHRTVEDPGDAAAVPTDMVTMRGRDGDERTCRGMACKYLTIKRLASFLRAGETYFLATLQEKPLPNI